MMKHIYFLIFLNSAFWPEVLDYRFDRPLFWFSFDMLIILWSHSQTPLFYRNVFCSNYIFQHHPAKRGVST